MHRRSISLRPASRTAIRTALPAIGIIAVLVLAGCTSGGSGKSAETPVGPLEKYLSALSDGKEYTQEQADKDNKKIEDLVAKCMTKEGFEYQPNTNNGNVVYSAGSDDGPEQGTTKFAKQYGYGIINSPGMEEVNQQAKEQVDPNQKYIDSLSESEQQAYQEALNGPMPSAEDEQAMQDGTYEYDPSKAGCYGKAQEKVYGSDDGTGPYEDPEFKELFENMQTMSMELYGGDGSAKPNADVAKLDSAWSDCMANSGYDFPAPQEAQNALYEEYNKLSMPNGDTGDFVEPSKKDKDKFQKREIEVATAEATCKEKVKYDDKLQKIQFALEQKFIDENKKQLDALVAKYGTKKKK